jgi:hypothetical protein
MPGVVSGYAEGPMAIYRMDYDGTGPVLLKDFEKAVARYPDWRGTPQQDDRVKRATVDEHTEQAVKDWQALPTAELQTYMGQIYHLLRQKKLRESRVDRPARRLAEKGTFALAIGHESQGGSRAVLSRSRHGAESGP